MLGSRRYGSAWKRRAGQQPGSCDRNRTQRSRRARRRKGTYLRVARRLERPVLGNFLLCRIRLSEKSATSEDSLWSQLCHLVLGRTKPLLRGLERWHCKVLGKRRPVA